LKKIFSKEIAGIILLITFGLLFIFQGLIVLNIIPYNIVWGGQLNEENYKVMSLFSIIIICLFMAIIAIKMKFIKSNILDRLGTIGAWIIFIYLILNTVGNIASASSVESIIFTPITIIMSIFALVLALSKE
jgi:hypothetical protein